jgi:hypothetical protein
MSPVVLETSNCGGAVAGAPSSRSGERIRNSDFCFLSSVFRLFFRETPRSTKAGGVANRADPQSETRYSCKSPITSTGLWSTT